MRAQNGIQTVPVGPEMEREVHERPIVERLSREARLQRPTEVNDPIVAAAIKAVEEVGSLADYKVDARYESETGFMVLTMRHADGRSVVRTLPPEDAIRLAQNIKNNRAQFFEGVF